MSRRAAHSGKTTSSLFVVSTVIISYWHLAASVVQPLIDHNGVSAVRRRRRRLVPGKALARSGGPQSWRGCTIQWNIADAAGARRRSTGGARSGPGRAASAGCAPHAPAPLASPAPSTSRQYVTSDWFTNTRPRHVTSLQNK